MVVVSSRMDKTYADRRGLVYSGQSTKDIMTKYPTLGFAVQVFGRYVHLKFIANV